MKKLLNILLIVASQFGYLEWGQEQSSFIYQTEIEIISKAMETGVSGILHPIIIIPIIGIFILIYTLFQKTPSKRLTYWGLTCLSLLFMIILLIGVMGFNLKMLSSCVPFFTVAVLLVLHHKKTSGQDLDK